jgi:hypothetical protein
LEDGALHAQLTHQSKYEIFAASSTEFFYRIVEARVVFQVGEDGYAPALRIYQNGRETLASRVTS